MKKQTLNEQVSRIKGMMKSINEGDYDSKGNYMGGTPPEYDAPGADSFLERDVEPDGFLKNKFGKDLDVEIVNREYDSSSRYGDTYQSILYKLVYNGGEELPEEMFNELDLEYNRVDMIDREDKEGNLHFYYLVLDKEYYDGFATP